MATTRLHGGLLTLLASSLLLSFGFAFTPGVFDGDTPNEPEPPPPPANSPLAVIMLRAGLDAEALCAVGVSADSIAALVGPIETQVDALPDALPNLDQAFAQAKVERDRLRRLVRSGQGTGDDVAALAQAIQAFETAETARTAYFEGLAAILSGAIAHDKAQQLTRVRTNRSWKLPTQYLVVDREERQWVDLREALAVKRIHENYGEDFPEDVQSYLASIDAVPAIAAAKVNLDTHLAAVQTAWNQAVTD